MNDTTQMPKVMQDRLYQLTRDADATLFMKQIWYLAQVWDDVIDEGGTDKVDDAFLTAISKIPHNRFYQRFMQELTPVINQTILDWRTANLMEQRRGPEDLNRAYMLRACIYRIFQYCLLLLHGFDEAVKMGPEIWSIYGETLESYKAEFEHA